MQQDNDQGENRKPEEEESEIIEFVPVNKKENADSAQKPSKFKQFFVNLLSPDTRAGRFMRPFLRWAAIVLGFFALGVLTVYLMLYQPAKQKIASQMLEVDALKVELEDTIGDLADVQAERDDLSAANQSLTNAVNQADLYASYLKIKQDVTVARLALAQDDNVTARTAVLDARDHLSLLMPLVAEKDAQLADLLKDRLQVIVIGVGLDDTQTIDTDLEKLSDAFVQMESLLFSEIQDE